MMRNILILTAVLGLLNVQGQKKAKPQPFNVSGTIKNYQSKKIYFYHQYGEAQFSDSADVNDGKFSIELKSPEPNLYFISTSPYPNAPASLGFFSDPKADIRINLHADSISIGKVTGGPSQKDHNDYRAMLNTFVVRQQTMQVAYSEAMQKNDTQTMERIRNEFQGMNNEFIDGMVKFVKEHPKSTVSGSIIYNDMNNPAIPFEKVVEALGYMDKSMADTRFVKLARQRVDAAKGSTIGFKATDFTQNDPDGKPIKLSDYKGKYVLVDFWASWCGPCRMENPNVVLAYNKYKDKNFTVLGVSFDNNKDKWLDAIQKDNLTWKHVSDLKGWGNEAGKLFNITSIPQNLLLDKEGVIVGKNLRGPALEEKLAELLK